ncbi:MAG: hypothetical protein ISQ11_16335 [Planctomycetes bacterium]|nr:hypothetical protein [Planctomycetota bacterium]
MLSWADFDLRSRRRVVLKEVPADVMDAALSRVEKSLEFHKANAGRRRVKRRLQEFRRASRRERELRYRTGHDAELTMTLSEAIQTPAGLAVLLIGGGFTAVLAFTADSMATMCAGVFTLLALSGMNSAGNRRRRRSGATGSHAHWATPMGVLGVGPPETLGRRRRARRITARLPRQRTREFTVGVEEDMHAGDVGVAYVRGDRIFRFKVMEHLASE